jgi:hypothetical protein
VISLHILNDSSSTLSDIANCCATFDRSSAIIMHSHRLEIYGNKSSGCIRPTTCLPVITSTFLTFAWAAAWHHPFFYRTHIQCTFPGERLGSWKVPEWCKNNAQHHACDGNGVLSLFYMCPSVSAVNRSAFKQREIVFTQLVGLFTKVLMDNQRVTSLIKTNN